MGSDPTPPCDCCARDIVPYNHSCSCAIVKRVPVTKPSWTDGCSIHQFLHFPSHREISRAWQCSPIRRCRRQSSLPCQCVTTPGSLCTCDRNYQIQDVRIPPKVWTPCLLPQELVRVVSTQQPCVAEFRICPLYTLPMMTSSLSSSSSSLLFLNPQSFSRMSS